MHGRFITTLTTAALFAAASTALAEVQVVQTDRDLKIVADGPDGYAIDVNRGYGIWRHLQDHSGSTLGTPRQGAWIGQPSLNPADWNRHIEYATQQAAGLRFYPVTSGDDAISNPVAAWGRSLTMTSAGDRVEGGVQVGFSNGNGENIRYTFGENSIKVQVSGGRGQYRAVMAVPVADANGVVRSDRDIAWLKGFGNGERTGTQFDIQSAYRDRAMRIAFSGAKAVFFEMPEGGRAADRSVQPSSGDMYLGMSFVIGNGETFEVSFPAAGGAELDVQRVMSMQPVNQGSPIGPSRGYWQADSVDLTTGGSLALRAVNGSTFGALGISNPVYKAYAADISDGDYDFYWKQVQPTYSKPGYYVFPKDDFWQEVPVTTSGNDFIVDLSSRAAGIYKVRVDVAPSNDPNAATTVQGDLFAAIGQSDVKVALFAQDMRHAFMRGEKIELTAVSRGRFNVVLRDDKDQDAALGEFEAGTAAKAGSATFMLDTGLLRPGRYKLRASAGDKTASYGISVVDPERETTIAVEDNSLGAAPFEWDLATNHFGGTKPSPWKHDFATPLNDLHLSSIRRTLDNQSYWAPQRELARFVQVHSSIHAADNFGPYSLNNPWFDSMVENRIAYFQGIMHRGLSFDKVTVIDRFLDGMTQKSAIIAQQLRRWPSFAGINFDVDTAQLTHELALRYSQLPDDVINNFRTELYAAQQADFEQVMAAPLAGIDQLPLGDRARATEKLWIQYLGDLFPRTNERYQAVLKSMDPALKQTSNTEYHHAPVQKGAYPPTMYKSLDVTSMEAWGDGRFYPLINAYWTEMAVGAAEIGAPGTPVWMQSQSYPEFTYDDLERNWWEVIGTGGDGIGFAANIFGLNMYGVQSHVADERRQRAVMLSDLITRYGPAFQAMDRTRDVALLYSFSEGARFDEYWYAGEFSNPLYLAYYSMMQLQYTPAIVYEESILDGALARHKVLVVARQTRPMPASVMEKITQFQAAGGKVLVDAATTVNIPGATRMDGVEFTEFSRDIPTEYHVGERFNRLRGPLWQHLSAAAPLPAQTTQQEALLFWFAKDDARYLIALNNMRLPTDDMSQAETGSRNIASLDFNRLKPNRDKLYLRDDAAVVYNMVSHEPLEVKSDDRGRYVDVDFTLANFQLLAFYPSELPELDVRANAARAGEPLFVDVQSALMRPITVELVAPSGTVRSTRHASTGHVLSFDLAANEEPGAWNVRVTDRVTGRRIAAPLSVTASTLAGALTPAPEVMTYDDAAYSPRLTQGNRLSIVVDSGQKDIMPIATDLQTRLRAAGVNAELWYAPPHVDEPVSWTYSQADNDVRGRISRGEVIGERSWRDHPDRPSWEVKTGLHIARDVILLGDASRNRYIRALEDEHVLRRSVTPDFPGEGRAVIEHVWSVFDAKHGAIVIGATDATGLQKGVTRLLELVNLRLDVQTMQLPNVSAVGNRAVVKRKLGKSFKRPPLAPRVSQDFLDAPAARDSLSLARERFLDGMGFDRARLREGAAASSANPLVSLGATTELEPDEPVDVAPPVSGLLVAPNGSFVAASLRTHGNNLVLMDGEGVVLWKRSAGIGENVKVTAVTNEGRVAIVTGRNSEIYNAAGDRIRKLDNEKVVWLSPDGDEYVSFSASNLTRARVSDGGAVWSAPHGVPPREDNSLFTFVVDPKRTMVVGPSFDGAADGNHGVPQNNSDIFLRGWDLDGGQQMWHKAGFFASAVAFSDNGDYISAAKKRFYYDENGQYQRGWAYQNDSILVMMNKAGEERYAERANVQLGKTVASDTGRWVLGIPYVVVPHAFLGLVGQPIREVSGNGEWIVDGCMMENGTDMALVTDQATVMVSDGEETLWTFATDQNRLWCDNPRVWIGSRNSIVRRVSKRGLTVWNTDLRPTVGEGF